jgi:hypothetical protein
MRSLLLLVSLSIAAVGCGTFVTYTPLNRTPRPLAPRPAASVELFSSAAPSRPHVDVALLEVEQNDRQGNAVMVQTLRERAGTMGCDAVFIVGTRERDGSRYDLGFRTLTATCIVYTDGANPAPPPIVEAPPDGQRRMCLDRVDFDRNRNCVLARGAI